MIRIGIVGCGRILAAHLRGYRLLREAGVDDFRITALCARREADARMYLARGSGPPQRPAVSQIAGDPLAVGDEYLSDFQSDIEVGVYTDYRQMINEAPIDAVNDFTTHAMHHQIAAAAFARGKHLLTQKPLAATVAAARAMCAEDEARDLVLGVFENFRFTPATRHLAWLFGGGPGGTVQMMLAAFIGVWWAPDLIVAQTPWRHRRDEGGGISLDLGVHFFDQFRHVAGEIRSVAARTSVLEPRRRRFDTAGNAIEEIECDADDTCLVDFETERGALGQLSASWGGHGGATTLGQGIVYYGTGGTATGDELRLEGSATESLAERYRREAPAAEQLRRFPWALADSFALAQLDWLRAVAGRRPPETDGREAVRDLAAAYAILESAHLGRRVDVDEVESGELREAQRPLDERFGLLG